MVCYDKSNAAIETLKLAQQHAKVWNAELEVVHTLTREEPLKYEFIQQSEEKLEKEIKSIIGDDDLSYNIHLFVTSLTPGEQLVNFAENQKVDQIFVGLTKTSKVGKFLFGSTAQYVILHSPCPVLTCHI
jgi:nucleotide-binding universal stress UspA family protein